MIDGIHFRLYKPAIDPEPIQRGTASGDPKSEPPKESSDDIDEARVTAFAYESDLRNFLSNNLNLLGGGLRLYDEEGITGIEFPAGGRFIDILALDGNGTYVVIELKVSRGYDRTVGQLRRYMGWIAQNQADMGQAVRGIIVAREISQDLILACRGLSDVELFEDSMSVSVKKV